MWRCLSHPMHLFLYQSKSHLEYACHSKPPLGQPRHSQRLGRIHVSPLTAAPTTAFHRLPPPHALLSAHQPGPDLALLELADVVVNRGDIL